jgi:hypothetical protein
MRAKDLGRNFGSQNECKHLLATPQAQTPLRWRKLTDFAA